MGPRVSVHAEKYIFEQLMFLSLCRTLMLGLTHKIWLMELRRNLSLGYTQ